MNLLQRSDYGINFNAAGSSGHIVYATLGGEVTINGGKFVLIPQNLNDYIYLGSNSKVVVNDGVFDLPGTSACFGLEYANGVLEINGGHFDCNTKAGMAKVTKGSLNIIISSWSLFDKHGVLIL